ncbi:hypothetical protein PtA15_18A458 [Puccinia triticina]|uniref:Uncharacterized protein n=1 Tax=Puccinia triticina TaxID=208348 RepID=A0ABY7D9M5_9BASI|nr:uncharacterized protein PtA15_18A458 [Puccinia triticina]WAQ93397.1 hypothetical protein PtA15_18A458 [Puccinia triticina]WAR63397.1 hypothetical protein PtB15_18B483 [Puccinia triticina]
MSSLPDSFSVCKSPRNRYTLANLKYQSRYDNSSPPELPELPRLPGTPLADTSRATSISTLAPNFTNNHSPSSTSRPPTDPAPPISTLAPNFTNNHHLAPPLPADHPPIQPPLPPKSTSAPPPRYPPGRYYSRD